MPQETTKVNLAVCGKCGENAFQVGWSKETLKWYLLCVNCKDVGLLPDEMEVM